MGQYIGQVETKAVKVEEASSKAKGGSDPGVQRQSFDLDTLDTLSPSYASSISSPTSSGIFKSTKWKELAVGLFENHQPPLGWQCTPKVNGGYYYNTSGSIENYKDVWLAYQLWKEMGTGWKKSSLWPLEPIAAF